MNIIDTEANKIRFKKLLLSSRREGIENFFAYLESTDFFTAPASTKYHLSCEGGLAQHSLNVYDCLLKKKNSPFWKETFRDIPDESIAIMALCHDLCKIHFYTKGTRNVKTYDPEKIANCSGCSIKHDSLGDFIWETVESYEVNDQNPLGHGEKSVIITSWFIRLTAPEMFAIRWHMGYTEDKSVYNTLGSAMEKYPVILALHEADLEASKLLEDTNGNKETETAS